MDIHIIYHIVVYLILFIPISLILRDSIITLLLLTLPIAGELVQIVLASNFPNIPYFWFSFEWIDVVTNTIGALMGLCIARLLSFLK